MTNEVAIEILEMLKIRPRRGSSIITAQTAVNVALQTGINALYEKKDREVWADEIIKSLEPKIKVLDSDEVTRKLGTVDIYQASAWVTLIKDLEYLGLKICEVKE